MADRTAADLVVGRPDGRDDGEEWSQNYQRLPGSAGISLILESTTREGQGPRLHRHPYAETFVIRRGGATFTLGEERVIGRAGQVLIAPAGGCAHRQDRTRRVRSRPHPRRRRHRDRMVAVSSPG